VANALILAATSRSVVSLDGATGSVRRTFPIPPPPSGSRVFPLGTGFLVAGPSSRVYQ
jgi:hypothetical protein